MPTMIALFFVAVVAMLSAMQVPAREAAVAEGIADAGATSLLAYREGVIDYLNANPTFAGTVPTASVTFPYGYTADARWTNLVVSGGTLYVYEATAFSPNTGLVLDKLYTKTLSSFMVGRNSGGLLVSAKGFATGITVPAAVPNGALLIVGK
jgi:hypothetical protein